MLVETDAPYLTPEPHRGTPNEPAYVVAVGEALGRARGESPDEIAAVTRANAARIFAVDGANR
jgi:TatD DNase family protein